MNDPKWVMVKKIVTLGFGDHEEEAIEIIVNVCAIAYIKPETMMGNEVYCIRFGANDEILTDRDGYDKIMEACP